jgi:hypothetical protein
VGELDRQVAALREELAGLSDTIRVYAGAFETRPPPAYILERGDPMRRSHAVSPGMPGHVRPRLDLAPEATDLERRRGLARFIAHEANPLAARVAVNRIWLAHFGRGIVATPGDFGFQGERPSHPELLDWLAARFHEDDGRAKPIHRRIVQSAAYRQANAVQSQGIERDAENQHIWRYASRRLEAEVLRDAMLECAGRLDRHMGGPGYTLWEPNTNYVVVFTPLVDPGPSSWRRMIYQFKPRSQPDPVFGAFDCPDGALVSPRRNRSTTALQALNLWNSAFVLSQCEGLTERVTREAGADARAQVDRAFQLVLSRSPAPGEAELAAELVRNHGAKALARVLFNSNEFVYTP